jgi:hypothetical protein
MRSLHLGRCQAENPLIDLSKFLSPALTTGEFQAWTLGQCLRSMRQPATTAAKQLPTTLEVGSKIAWHWNRHVLDKMIV